MDFYSNALSVHIYAKELWTTTGTIYENIKVPEVREWERKIGGTAELLGRQIGSAAESRFYRLRRRRRRTDLRAPNNRKRTAINTFSANRGRHFFPSAVAASSRSLSPADHRTVVVGRLWVVITANFPGSCACSRVVDVS